MIFTIHNDCLEIIMKQCDIDSYLNCLQTNKTMYNSLHSLKLEYYYCRNKLSALYNKNTIKFCTNSKCPNKLHLEDTVRTTLTEKDLDADLMIDYKNILSDLRKGTKYGNRFDKTITYEFINLKKVCNIGDIPYCQDCLIEYNPELYEVLEENCDETVSETSEFM